MLSEADRSTEGRAQHTTMFNFPCNEKNMGLRISRGPFLVYYTHWNYYFNNYNMEIFFSYLNMEFDVALCVSHVMLFTCLAGLSQGLQPVVHLYKVIYKVIYRLNPNCIVLHNDHFLVLTIFLSSCIKSPSRMANRSKFHFIKLQVASN